MIANTFVIMLIKLNRNYSILNNSLATKGLAVLIG